MNNFSFFLIDINHLLHIFIVFVPFFVFIFISFYGRGIGFKNCVIVANSMMFISSFFIYVIILFFEDSNIFFNSSNLFGSIIGEVCWFRDLEVEVSFIFFFDSLSIIMLFVVTIVSTFVHLYTYGYMKYEPQLSRFISYLSLFTFFMNILVTSGNLVQMFFGWEGVGLASYLLINMWFLRLDATKAALKAVILNRFGDLAFILGVLSVYDVFGSLDFLIINSLTPYVSGEFFEFLGIEINKVSLITFLFVLAAMAKSAQFGLHVWLPDAMEGPTPVSALIHAATMVTAGIFLLVRISILLDYSGWVLGFIVLLGGVTTFFGSSIALVQRDIKKIIAYSTCSQLGYMFMACGMSQYGLAIFHLFNHAFFKALLFLSAGCIIFVLNGQQDIRYMGGLWQCMPLTWIFMSMGSISLSGLPYLSGYYSKDLILEILYGVPSFLYVFSFFLGFVSSIFTVIYSMRLLYLVFFKKPSIYCLNIYYSLVDSFGIMFYSLGKLVFYSIISGIFFLFGFLKFDFLGFTFVLPIEVYILEGEFIIIFVKLCLILFPYFIMESYQYISLFLMIKLLIRKSLQGWLGIFSSIKRLLFIKITKNLIKFNSLIVENKLLMYFFYLLQFKLLKIKSSIVLFLSRAWFIDDIYNYLVIFFLNFTYNYAFKGFDGGIINFLGFKGPIDLIYKKLSQGFIILQAGFLYNYIYFFFFSIVFYYYFFYFVIVDEVYIYMLFFLFLYKFILKEKL